MSFQHSSILPSKHLFNCRPWLHQLVMVLLLNSQQNRLLQCKQSHEANASKRVRPFIYNNITVCQRYTTFTLAYNVRWATILLYTCECQVQLAPPHSLRAVACQSTPSLLQRADSCSSQPVTKACTNVAMRRRQANDELDEAAVAGTNTWHWQQWRVYPAIGPVWWRRQLKDSRSFCNWDDVISECQWHTATRYSIQIAPSARPDQLRLYRYSASVGTLADIHGWWRLRNVLSLLQTSEHHQFYNVDIVDCHQRIRVA